MILLLLICMAGFILLYFGAEWLVKGSSSLAGSLGITPIVIGLTVVAFGTSAPELMVSIVSSLQGKSMIAIGNVVGSNICNIALILGISALFQPIVCHYSVVRRDIPVMLGISALVFIFSANSIISRIEGVILFSGVILYTFFNYHVARYEGMDSPEDNISPMDIELAEITGVVSRWKQILLIVLGILGVLIGARMVVDTAIRIMTILGVSEIFIGLTIVALGTSLPELATSVVAALKKEMDISLGNLVGSNVFNLLSVVGAAATAKPIFIPGGFFQSALVIDYSVMILISFLPWLMMRKSPVITRGNGGFLLGCYAAYIIYLIAKI